MTFGDAFDAHDLKAAYEALVNRYAERCKNGANYGVVLPRHQWPDLPNTEAAHAQRQWLDALTVGDAEFLHGLGIDPVG